MKVKDFLKLLYANEHRLIGFNVNGILDTYLHINEVREYIEIFNYNDYIIKEMYLDFEGDLILFIRG